MTTKIQWADETWNPTTGCAKVSEGCKNCYAAASWSRMGKLLPEIYGGREFTDVRCHPERLIIPMQWRKPRKIFVDSMSDLFHENIPDEFIDAVFAVMNLSRNHIFMVLTKRPKRMFDYMRRIAKDANILERAARSLGYTFSFNGKILLYFPFENVWLGVSVENQKAADERIPLLLQTPAAKRFVSVEPMLGHVDLVEAYPSNFISCGCGWYGPDDGDGGPKFRRDKKDKEHYERICPSCGNSWDNPVLNFDYVKDCNEACEECNIPGIDWVICGGESGKNARPMHPDWVRSLRDQCAEAKVPFMLKQWGEWCPDGQFDKTPFGSKKVMCQESLIDPMVYWRIGKKAAGRMLDGCLHDEYPNEAVQ